MRATPASESVREARPGRGRKKHSESNKRNSRDVARYGSGGRWKRWNAEAPNSAFHSPGYYKLRRKFNRSCCCELLSPLKLLITEFASELHEMLWNSGSYTLLVVST